VKLQDNSRHLENKASPIEVYDWVSLYLGCKMTPSGSWQTMDCQGHPDDILGDGSVMKSIIEEGEEPAVYPIFGDECITHFVGSLPDGSVFNDTMKRDQPFK